MSLLFPVVPIVIITTLIAAVPVSAQERDEAVSIAEQVAAKRVNEHHETLKKLEKAESLYQEEKYQEAIDILSEILDKNPDHENAKELMNRCVSKQKATMVADVVARKQRSKQNIMKNLDNEFIELWIRPDEVDKQRDNALQQMLKAVKELWELGRYNEALEGCEEMIDTYPPDVTSRVKINEILEDMRLFAKEESEVVKRKRILAVRKAWLPPKYDNGKQEDQEEYETDPIISVDKQQLLAKANRVIPEINFANAHLRDVIQYLSKISGVNIILDESHLTASASAGTEDSLDNRVTISLKNIPLIEALKYILISRNMEYRVEDHAIWIAQDVKDVEMITRIYQLPSGSGVIHEIKYEGSTKQEEFNNHTTIDTGGDITQLLREAVPFPPGSKVYLDPRTGNLLVTNTVANHSLIEEVLKNISKPPIQIQIEAKFIKITETSANELGLEFFLTENWNFHHNSNVLANSSDPTYGQQAGSPAGRYGFTRALRFGGTNGNPSDTSILRFSGVLTEPQFSAIIHAISQNDMADIISAPKLTTVNGQQAIIKDVEEYIYPLEFTITQATFNDEGTAITPSVVSVGDFQTRKVGIILSVTPNAGADKKTINLTVIPEVSNIATWINFGTDNAPIRVPHFDSENVVTTVVLNDGETVVMGGLMRENTDIIKDKIPILGDIPYIGRTFRMDREESTKTNLLIFVTAKIIEPTGVEHRNVVSRD
jgi:general secretion pathway protein D